MFKSILDAFEKFKTQTLPHASAYLMNLKFENVRRLKWVDDPKKNKKVNIFLLGGVSTLLVLSVFAKTAENTLKAGCARLLSDNHFQDGEGPRVNVEATPVHLGLMSKRVTAVGRTRAIESVTIKSETNARIKEILFTPGGHIEKGQVILEFENDDLKARLQSANVRLEAARSQFERSKKLQQKKLGTSKDFDKDKAEFDGAKAQVDQFTAELDKTIIKAPFTGQIGLIDVNVGAYVSANTDLVTMVQSNPMKIDFKIPEKFAKDVGSGQIVEFKIHTFKDRVFTAYVEAVDSKVDSDSSSIAVRATTNNDLGELLPGLAASLELIIGERSNTPMIDEAAVMREGVNEYAWIIRKGRAYRQGVRTGVHEKGMVEIVSGLTRGDLVVTSGHVRLHRDGTAVKVLNSQAQQSESIDTAADSA